MDSADFWDRLKPYCLFYPKSKSIDPWHHGHKGDAPPALGWEHDSQLVKTTAVGQQCCVLPVVAKTLNHLAKDVVLPVPTPLAPAAVSQTPASVPFTREVTLEEVALRNELGEDDEGEMDAAEEPPPHPPMSKEQHLKNIWDRLTEDERAEQIAQIAIDTGEDILILTARLRAIAREEAASSGTGDVGGVASVASAGGASSATGGPVVPAHPPPTRPVPIPPSEPSAPPPSISSPVAMSPRGPADASAGMGSPSAPSPAPPPPSALMPPPSSARGDEAQGWS